GDCRGGRGDGPSHGDRQGERRAHRHPRPGTAAQRRAGRRRGGWSGRAGLAHRRPTRPMDLSFDLEPGDDVVYTAEAIEQIETIERGLLDLERHAGDEATLAEMFRAAHTLKGSAATIGHQR